MTDIIMMVIVKRVQITIVILNFLPFVFFLKCHLTTIISTAVKKSVNGISDKKLKRMFSQPKVALVNQRGIRTTRWHANSRTSKRHNDTRNGQQESSYRR